MRLLCTGDFHLGAGADYGARPGDRLADQDDVLNRITDIAVAEAVDAVLFAGDAFERRSPTPSELLVWSAFVSRLDESQIPWFAIAGNHDVAHPDLPTAMEVLDDIARGPESYGFGDLTIACLPWTPPSRLVAAAGGGDRDEIHARAAELLLDTASGLRAQINGPAILLAHWSVSGASLPNGLPVADLREPVLDYAALAEQGWDYVVLGHIHKPQWFHHHPMMFYVGSPTPLNFGEVSRPNDEYGHGVWLIDTDRPDWRKFVEIESRPFVTVEADLTEPVAIHPPQGRMVLDEPNEAKWLEAQYAPSALEYLDATDQIAAAIAEHFPLTDAVVRIRYRATAEQARRVDHAALRKLVADAGASKLYSIQPEIVKSDRARVEGVDESISPLESLSAWITANDIQEQAAQSLHDKTAIFLEEVGA